MGINQDEIIVNGQKIGVYDLYDVTGLVHDLTSDKSMQEALLQGASTVLEILHSAVDQRIITSFEIIHK